MATYRDRRQFRRYIMSSAIQCIVRLIAEGNEEKVFKEAKRLAHDGALELRFKKSQATKRYNSRLKVRKHVQGMIDFWFAELAIAEKAGDFEEYSRAIDGIEHESNRLVDLV